MNLPSPFATACVRVRDEILRADVMQHRASQLTETRTR